MVFVCCVPNCNNKSSVNRSFPVYHEEIFNIWLDRIGNETLNRMDPLRVYKNYRVCDKHFSNHCQVEGSKRLKLGSLPTILLPNFHQESTEENSIFIYHSVLDVDNCPSVASSSKQPDVESTTFIETMSSTSSGHKRTSFDIQLSASTSTTTEHTRSTPRDVRRSTGFLKIANVTRVNQLTPKAKKLYQAAKNLQSVKRRLEFSNQTARERLQQAYDMLEARSISTQHINTATQNFLLSQMRHQKKTPRGRRFSMNEKIFALAIMKQSFKGYRLLSKIFALPSRSTLTKMLTNINFYVGINNHILNSLKHHVKKMPDVDRFCCLMFDEMSISPGLNYNQRHDVITGFTNDGVVTSRKYADHVLVFMLRGIHRKWKQPISYHFVEHSTSSAQLKNLLQQTISQLNGLGFHVVATVCDQGTTNRAAINMLLTETTADYSRKGEENTYFGFIVDGKEIVPLYDPPHLLKGVRNNLLVRNISFSIKGQHFEASWQDILSLYELNMKYEGKKLCLKWTDQHIVPEKILKMKVSCAAQVFSQRAAAIMNFAADCGKLPDSAHGTSELLDFMDKLFDSVNGMNVFAAEGKNLRVAVTDTSGHLQFWNDAIEVLSGMKFVDSSGHSRVQPPSIKNWIWTLKGLKHLWNNLRPYFQFLSPRNFNQDPLENFFGCIRSQGVRNVNPTCSAFMDSFKTLIVNNFMHPHSPSANCKEDISEGALSTLRQFITDDPADVHIESVHPENLLKLPVYIESNEVIERNINVYMAGFIAKRLLHRVNCTTCAFTLSKRSRDGPDEVLLRRRAYNSKCLCVPGTAFSKIFSEIYFYCENLVPQICYKPRIKHTLINIIEEEIEKKYSIIFCTKHDLVRQIIDSVTTFYILSWIRSTNRILHGRSNIVCPSVDPAKREAFLKFSKSRKRIRNN